MTRSLLPLLLVSACASEVAPGTDRAPSAHPDGKADGTAMRAYVEGDAAQTLYEALAVEGEHDGAYTTTKRAVGELVCVVRAPWGAPASTSCAIDGLLEMEGPAAEALSDDFDVEGEHDGGYHTTKRGQGTLLCAERAPSQARTSYRCYFTMPVLEIEGELANQLYDALAFEGEHDGGYHTTKWGYGTLACTMRTPWDAPASYSCDMGEEGEDLQAEGALAQGLFEALRVEGEHDGGYHTRKAVFGALACTVRTPWDAPARYRCAME